MIFILLYCIFAQVKVPCANPTIRKEIRSLTSMEWGKVKRVFSIMKIQGTLRKYSQMHNSYFSRMHNNVYFAYWHRELLWRFEQDMKRIDSTVTLPYWNWSLDADKYKWNFDKTEIWTSHYLGYTQNRCVKGGPFGINNYVDYPFRHCISRNLRRDILPSGGSTLAAIIATPYGIEYFSKLLESGPHILFHLHVGGDMGVGYSSNDIVFYLHHAFIDYALSQYQYVHNVWTADRFTPYWKNAPIPLYNTKVIDLVTMKNRCVQYDGSFPTKLFTTQRKIQRTIIRKRELLSSGNITMGNDKNKIIVDVEPMPTISTVESEESPEATETEEFMEEIDIVDSVVHNKTVKEEEPVDIFVTLHAIYSSALTPAEKWNSSVQTIGSYFGKRSFMAVNNNITDRDFIKLGMVPEHARYLERQMNNMKMFVGNATKLPVYDVKKKKSIVPQLELVKGEEQQSSSTAAKWSVCIVVLLFIK